MILRPMDRKRPGGRDLPSGERFVKGDRMKNRSEKSGFTLVELLVVIVIIAILAGLLLPAIVGALNNTKKTACGNNLGQLWKQMMNYQIQYGGTSKIMPTETGENFWKALTLTTPPMQKANDDVYVC